jgi:hypothetical protein
MNLCLSLDPPNKNGWWQGFYSLCAQRGRLASFQWLKYCWMYVYSSMFWRLEKVRKLSAPVASWDLTFLLQQDPSGITSVLLTFGCKSFVWQTCSWHIFQFTFCSEKYLFLRVPNVHFVNKKHLVSICTLISLHNDDAYVVYTES